MDTVYVVTHNVLLRGRVYFTYFCEIRLNQLHCIMQYHLASLIGWYKCLATTQQLTCNSQWQWFFRFFNLWRFGAITLSRKCTSLVAWAITVLFFLVWLPQVNLSPLVLLELLSYWHAANGHSSVLISGSAHVSAIVRDHLFLFISLFLFRLFSYWLEWGDADWRKLITWLFSHRAHGNTHL